MLRPKCLFLIKGLRKEGHGQKDDDLLFKSIVLSKLTYGLSIYGASKADLFVVDCFLKRRPKKRYISDKLGIYDLFEQSDRKLYDKISKDEHHPLYAILPTAEDCSQRLRRKTFQLPLVKTERFKNCFVNRLCFNYNLAIWYYFNCNF